MKIVIFGVGKYYQNRKKKIPSNTEILAFLDNDPVLQGKYMDGIKIVSPCKISDFLYDKVIIMSSRSREMRHQLLEYNVDEEDIWHGEYFISMINRGVLKFCCGNRDVQKNGKRILVIASEIVYNGATFAIIYAVLALQNRGHMVVLAASGGKQELIDEIVSKGINVVICPALPYLYKEELFWIRRFEVILVNIFYMILAACEISKIRPVMWWIHESTGSYKNVMDQFQEYADKRRFTKINICAVSDVAKRNFEFHFSNRIDRILSYGIPDKCEKIEEFRNRKGSPIVFAIIGRICSLKAQDVFVRAAQSLESKYKHNVQFWIIGSPGKAEYYNEIKKAVSGDDSFKMWGELTQDELHCLYRMIDIVVSPSLEDCLPIVMTEGMMYGKVCIASDATGTVRYITQKKNGLICKAGDSVDLSDKMKWVIENYDSLESMRKKARKTYETYFSMKSFGEQLEDAIQDTIVKYIFDE